MSPQFHASNKQQPTRLHKQQPAVRKEVCTMKRTKATQNSYSGFHPTSDSVPVITLDDYDQSQFFHEFVLLRKPCLINGPSGLELDQFLPGPIVDLLRSDDLLLVEKKDKGGYGSGTERLKMSFQTFMDTLKAGIDDYYLTTQYTEDDPEEVQRALVHKLAMEEGDEENMPTSGENGDEDSNDDDEDNGGGIPKDTFSETDSIDFSNLHDDFEDMEQDGSESEDLGDLITTNVPGEPLCSEEADRRVKECLQKPLTKLVGKIPLSHTLIPQLVTQQINIWIGKYREQEDAAAFKPDPQASDFGLGRRIFGGGVSSGLHHDHADNIYILACGSKRFTIFSPLDASKMDTVGNINRVYPSGVIDYKNDDSAPGWRELRGDSAIVTEVAKYRLDNEQDMDPRERELLIQSIEKEEEMLRDFEAKVIDNDGIKKDPPSFSKIPASLLHLDKIEPQELREKLTQYAEERWPDLFKAQRITVQLEPGQMLYLPAGWFHEVTSFGSPASGDFHVALNYWFSPPCADGIEPEAYADKYWEHDFERTKAACDYYARIGQ